MDDLVSEFITETAESLAVLDQELVKLEQNPNDPAILGSIFRIVHTIKGTCGFLGLPKLESVAHASENVLGKIRDKKMEVTPAAISIILESLDCIKSIMEHLSAHGEESAGDNKDLITRLNYFADYGKPMEGAAPAASATAEILDDFDFVPIKAEDTPTSIPAAPAPAAAAPAPAPVAEAPKPAAVKEAPKEAAPAKDKEATGDLANQSIRVNLDVLENLMQMVGELVLTRNQLLQIVRTRNDNVFMGPLQTLSHITTELQEGVMKTRMQPIGNAWAKFPRLIRDLALELGKKIELRMVGAETELDRQLLEMIKDPLTHMVRNSADHGLETIEGRKAAGKAETGIVTLSAYHEGGHIIIEISDDGRGINIDRVKEKAVSNGLVTADEIAQMPDQRIIQFIFAAGFSTAEKVTSVSGRGVGMDVVKTNIEKIGGTVELKSNFGKGSTFTIKIPLTLAIVSVLIVEASGERFAIPQINVMELVRAAKEYQIEMINDTPVLRLREKLLPLISLSRVLEIKDEEKSHTGSFIVVCRVGAHDFGLLVDRIFDTEEIVVKPVSRLISHIPVYSGNTILGDGRVIMILDPNGLARASGINEINSGGKVEHAHAATERTISFLLFKAGEGAPKAVPLELVSRLEKIDVAKIEWSNDRRVVQYRGDLMRLVTLDENMPIPETGECEVIVFSYDNKTLGLMVEEIMDIIDAPLAMKLSAAEPGYLGSMVIMGRTTDIIDVGSLLSQVIEDLSALDYSKTEQGAKRHRLILVEDSPFFRNITAPALSAAGYVVTAVETAREALKHMEEHGPVDVIVTDIEMPEMDGFEFAELCRDNARYNKIPLIAFTSTVNQETLARGRHVGFNDFIDKTDREGLLRAIAKNLSTVKEAA